VVYPHSLFTSDNIATLIIGNNTNNILLLSLRSDFHDRNQKSTEIDTPPLIGTGDKRHFPYAENFEFLKIHRERWPNPIGAKAALGHELERLEFAWMHLDSVRRQAIREAYRKKGEVVPENLDQRSWRTDVKLVALVVDSLPKC